MRPEGKTWLYPALGNNRNNKRHEYSPTVVWISRASNWDGSNTFANKYAYGATMNRRKETLISTHRSFVFSRSGLCSINRWTVQKRKILRFKRGFWAIRRFPSGTSFWSRNHGNLDVDCTAKNPGKVWILPTKTCQKAYYLKMKTIMNWFVHEYSYLRWYRFSLLPPVPEGLPFILFLVESCHFSTQVCGPLSEKETYEIWRIISDTSTYQFHWIHVFAWVQNNKI